MKAKYQIRTYYGMAFGEWIFVAEDKDTVIESTGGKVFEDKLKEKGFQEYVKFRVEKSKEIHQGKSKFFFDPITIGDGKSFTQSEFMDMSEEEYRLFQGWGHRYPYYDVNACQYVRLIGKHRSGNMKVAVKEGESEREYLQEERYLIVPKNRTPKTAINNTL